jgi:hypothetical protein
MPVGKPVPKSQLGNPDVGRSATSASSSCRRIVEGKDGLPDAIVETPSATAVCGNKQALDTNLIVALFQALTRNRRQLAGLEQLYVRPNPTPSTR